MIRSLLKFSAITFLALSVTWIMLTRTVGTRVVPQVAGLPEKEAIRILENADLEAGVERNYTKTHPAGVVYRQSPAANYKVKEGRRVRLLVSLGEATSVMPDLRGLSLTEAKNRLRSVGTEKNVRGGLILDMESRTPHATIPADHVISHFPPPGQDVVIGEKVQLLISKGPPQTAVIVPNVIGMPLDEAEAALTQAGLIVQRITKELSSREPGRVLRAIPEPGTPLASGEGVTLVLGIPRATSVSVKPRMILIRYVVPLIMEPLPFNIMIADREGNRNLYAGNPNPGQVLEFAERVVGDAELKVYIDGILSQTRTYRAP